MRLLSRNRGGALTLAALIPLYSAIRSVNNQQNEQENQQQQHNNHQQYVPVLDSKMIYKLFMD